MGLAKGQTPMFKKNLKLLAFLLSFTLVCLAILGTFPAAAKGILMPDEVAVGQLPAQAQNTYSLIQQGGPFPYEKDGVVFGNYERQLPLQKRGYYHEYTVKMPRTKTRGATRIVCGGLRRTAPDVCYYTNDHYATFRKISL